MKKEIIALSIVCWCSVELYTERTPSHCNDNGKTLISSEIDCSDCLGIEDSKKEINNLLIPKNR